MEFLASWNHKLKRSLIMSKSTWRWFREWPLTDMVIGSVGAKAIMTAFFHKRKTVIK